MSFIEFRSVSKSYENGKNALFDLSFSVNRGEFLYIVGENGSGKSTLLELLIAAHKADEGQIKVNNQDIYDLTRDEIPYYRRSFGIISPRIPLISEFDVFYNVSLPLNIAGAKKIHIKKAVELALGSVGMRGSQDSNIEELSGGEQMKIMIARAIITNPVVLIADEPTANLNIDDAWDILNLLEHVNHSGTTIIMATHQKKLVDITRKRVLRLKKGKLVSDIKKGKY